MKTTMTTNIDHIAPGIDSVEYRGHLGYAVGFDRHEAHNDGRWLVTGVDSDEFTLHLVFDYATATLLADRVACGKVYDVNPSWYGDNLPVYVGIDTVSVPIAWCPVQGRHFAY
jgi:hypothetical protein